MAANLSLCVFVVVLVHFIIAIAYYYVWRRNSLKCFEKKKILFVTAHPDDECMFFAPSILHLARCGLVRLLCLSNGNYFGLGKIREKELLSSCSLLGIPPENVEVLNKTELPDHQTASWQPDVVSSMILKECKQYDIELVITFDGYGVSGHPNHISIYEALRKMLQDRTAHQPQFYVLESTNIVRKYISLFDISNSVFAKYVFLSSFQDFRISQRAMAAHKSQMVWFRRLYIIFSRYMFINTLQKCSNSC